MAYLLVCLITWQIPPFFLVNVVHSIRLGSKYSPHLFLHSKLNCIFSVVSLSTSDWGLLFPVLPQPATAHLMLAGIFPSFLGSPIVFTYLLSVAFFFNCEREQSQSIICCFALCCTTQETHVLEISICVRLFKTTLNPRILKESVKMKLNT